MSEPVTFALGRVWERGDFVGDLRAGSALWYKRIAEA